MNEQGDVWTPDAEERKVIRIVLALSAALIVFGLANFNLRWLPGDVGLFVFCTGFFILGGLTYAQANVRSWR